MNRRTFLKAVGLSVALPSVMVVATISFKPVMPQYTLTADMIRDAARSCARGHKRDLHYLMFIHPNQATALRTIVAKDKYKFTQHKMRWEKWSGKKYPEPELSIWEG